MHTLLGTVAALAVAATLVPLARAGDDVPVTPPPRYRLQSLGVLPGDDYSLGYAINNQAMVAGGSFKEGARAGRLFLYGDGRMQALGPLRGDYARPWALNEHGDIVGASADASGHLRPFLYRDGRLLDLAASLGAREGRALGLNAAGQAMGEADDQPFFYDGTSSHYLKSVTGGALRGFGTALNDAGVGVGGVVADSGYKTFVHEDGHIRLLDNPEDYEGWGDFYGRDINNAGQILVNHMYTADDYGGTLIYDHGRYERIGGLSDFGIDINNKGWVLYDDSYFDPEWGDYNWTPALFRDGARAQLRDLLTPGAAAHWEVSAAYGLNDAGQIVGSGYFDGRLRAFIATPVPESGSAALLLAGLAVVGAAAGRGSRLRGGREGGPALPRLRALPAGGVAMRRLLRSLAAALALTAASTVPSQAAPGETPRYRVQDLGALPGDRYSFATAVNNLGAVAGESYPDEFDSRRRGQAFLYRDGLLQGLGTLGGAQSVAHDLNDRGDVVGDALDASGRQRPFFWRDGRMLDLATSLGAREGQAWGLNAAGQAVGDADGRAFFYDGTRSRYVDVSGTDSSALGLNDHGVGVGGVNTDTGYRPFRFDSRGATLLPNPDMWDGYGDFYARDINNAGQILVNQIETSDFHGGAYLYSHGSYEYLGFIDYGATDLNNRGWVVGAQYYYDANVDDFVQEALLYRDGVRYTLNDVMRPADAGHWELISANGLNDAGAIVGAGYHDGQMRAYIATPVPEPANAALLLAGLAVVGMVAARRKRA